MEQLPPLIAVGYNPLPLLLAVPVAAPLAPDALEGPPPLIPAVIPLPAMPVAAPLAPAAVLAGAEEGLADDADEAAPIDAGAAAVGGRRNFSQEALCTSRSCEA